jgi:hypothetical protein
MVVLLFHFFSHFKGDCMKRFVFALLALAFLAPTTARAADVLLGGTECLVGSNGDLDGMKGVVTFDNDAEVTSGMNCTWDENLQDGLDSDWVLVTGVYTWNYIRVNVADHGYTGVFDLGDTIDMVRITATVHGANRQASVRDIVVTWWNTNDPDLHESMSISNSDAPVASTFGSSDPDDFATRKFDALPEGSGYDMVKVSYYMRLESLAPFPSPDAAYVQQALYHR